MLMPSVFNHDILSDFFEDPFFDDRDIRRLEKQLYGHKGQDLMKTDVKETATSYEMKMDLPGFKKDEIQVSLKDGYLTIHAAKEIKEDKNGRFLRRERCAGVCERSFYVGKQLCEDEIRAEFKHGILKLTLPKQNKKPIIEEKKYIAIEG